MSLEALSHVASAAFPIFEQEKIDASSIYRGKDRIPADSLLSTHMSALPPPIPMLSRHSSYNVPYSIPAKAVDWCRQITLEERRYIREKIKAAYQNKTKTFEELLELSCAIEEEFIFASAPSRLDYFKSGVQYDKRVAEKENQMKSSLSGSLRPRDSPSPSSESVEDSVDQTNAKRAKT